MGNFKSKPTTPAQVHTPATKDRGDYVIIRPTTKKTKSRATQTDFPRLHTAGEKFISMLAKETKERNIQRMHLNAFNAKNSDSEYAKVFSKKEPVKSGVTSGAAMFQHAPKARTEAQRISAGVERRSTFK